MSIILSSTVYVWCASRGCVGFLDFEEGYATTFGGSALAELVLYFSTLRPDTAEEG